MLCWVFSDYDVIILGNLRWYYVHLLLYILQFVIEILKNSWNFAETGNNPHVM